MNKRSRISKYDKTNNLMSDDFTDALTKKELKKFKKEQEKIKEEARRNENELKTIEEEIFREQLEKRKINNDSTATERLMNENNTTQELDMNSYVNRVIMPEDYEEKSKDKNSLNSFTNFILIITIICGLIYLGYSIYISNQLVDNIYTIINSSFITAIIILFSLSAMSNKNKLKKGFSILTSLIFIEFLAFNGLVSINYLKLPTQSVVKDFTNKSVNNVIKWAKENKVEVVQTTEYSDTVDENKIISQSAKANTLVKNIDKLEIVSSSGPNPGTVVNLKDMLGWSIDEVVKEIEKEKLINVNIEYEFSELTKDTVIDQSKKGVMHRSDDITIKLSLGNEEDLKPVNLIDLVNKKEFDATLWLKRNGIKYEITKEFSDSIKKGNVISSDPVKDTLVNQKETTLKLVISRGKKIVVPNLLTMSINKIVKWANKNNLNIIYNTAFDNKVKKGKIIGLSVKENDVIESDTDIYITISKGKLKMISYGKDDINKIRKFASTYDIKLNEIREFSKDVEAGKIISVSKKAGEGVQTGESIDVVISSGSKIIIPDFTNMDLNAAKDLCNKNKLDCSISYANSTKNKNKIIGQNKRSGSEVIEGTNVVLTVSNGIKPSRKSTTSTSTRTSSKTTTTNKNTSNTSTKPTSSCNKTKNLTLNLMAGDSAAKTKDGITNQNPGIKFKWIFVDQCPSTSADSGTVCSTSVEDGSAVSACDVVTITVVK